MSTKRSPFAILRPFFHGLGVFTQRLPALITCGIFLGIAWGDWGGEYGVPNLLWQHHDAGGMSYSLVQFANGASIAVLFGYVWLVTFVVEVRMRGRHDIAAIAPEPPRWLGRIIDSVIPPAQNADDFSERMRLYFALTWLPLLALMALAACFRVSVHSPLVLGQRWPLLGGMLTVVALVALLHRQWSKRSMDRSQSMRNLASILFFTVFASYLVLSTLNCSTAMWRPLWLRLNHIPPIISLCVLLGVLNGLAGSVWYVCGKRAPWAFLGLAAYFLFCNCYPYKERFEALDYNRLLNVSDAEEPEAPPPGAQELKVPGIADDVAERQQQQRMLAAGCARLHASLFAAGQPEDFATQDYEHLFLRYRKLQLMTVHINLCRQLNEPIPDPVSLDRQSYAELFTSYHGLRSAVGLIEEKRFLDSWRDNLAKQERGAARNYKPRLAVLAVSGGANRSAYWVSVALTAMERELKGPGAADGESRFPSHLRLIAGASGGMVGASQYVSTLDPQGRHVAWTDHDDRSWTIAQDGDGKPVPVKLLDKYDPVAQADYLTPVMDRLVFCDVPFALMPASHYMLDRGHCLEDCFNGTTHEMEQPFAVLRAGEEAGWRPSMVFSPMLVEDGRRLLISNLPLAYLATSSGAMLLGDASCASNKPDVRRSQFAKTKANRVAADTEPSWRDAYARSAVELFRLFPDVAAQFKLSTAARMSATFPYISPAVELPTDPPRRVVDAGYFDNYGVDVAAGWIGSHRRWLKANTSGVVLIQLRDGPSNTRRRQLVDPEESSQSLFCRRWNSSFRWVVSPLDGATSAYFAVPSFRNDEHLQSLDRWFNDDLPNEADRPFFTTVVFERPGEMAMNWDLEKDKLDLIQNGMKSAENGQSMTALKDWWGVGYGNPY